MASLIDTARVHDRPKAPKMLDIGPLVSAR
jgi:hypothetical protein